MCTGKSAPCTEEWLLAALLLPSAICLIVVLALAPSDVGRYHNAYFVYIYVCLSMCVSLLKVNCCNLYIRSS